MAMKFSKNDYSKLYKSFKSSIQQNTSINNWNSDSTIRNIIEPVIAELTRLNSTISTGFDAMQLGKAKGADLDMIGVSYGIPRLRPSRSSTGANEYNFHFYAPSNFGALNNNAPIVIPSGTQITVPQDAKGRTLVYTTVGVYTLNPSHKITYCSIQCVAMGYEGNVSNETLIEHNFTDYAQSASGLLKCSNRYGIFNGRKAETDDRYRFRLSQRYTTLSVSSRNAVQLRGMETAGINKTRFIKNWFGIGHSAIFCFGADNEISSALIQTMQRKIDNLVGLSGRVTALPGVRVYLDIEITIWVDVAQTSQQAALLKTKVLRAMHTFVKQDLSKGEIDLAAMRSFITSSVTELVAVSSRYSRDKMFEAVYIRRGYGGDSRESDQRVRLTSLNYSIEDNEFFALGTIKVNLESS